MIRFERVKAGDELWDAHRNRTVMREMANWRVRIIEINHAEGWALVSWNGNPPTRYSRRSVEALRRSPYRKGLR